MTVLLALLPVSIVREPHHKVLFQNLKVRALQLSLKPGEATALHRHDGYYAFFSLNAVSLSNEVPGRQAKVTQFEPGELHTSRGGFELVERNISQTPADLRVIELLNPNLRPFASPMGEFKYQGTLYSDLCEVPGFRAYSMKMSPGGMTEKHEEKYDRLLVAITDLSLQDTGQHMQLKAGDVQWLPARAELSMTNVGNAPGEFILFELN